MPLGNLGVAMVVYFILGLMRAIRFRMLLEDRSVPMAPLFGITMVHNTLVQLVPMRVGEVAYPLLLRYRLNQRTSAGISSLITVRIFDFLFVSLGLLIGLVALVSNLPDVHSRQILAVVAAIAIGVAAFSVAETITRRIAAFVGRLKNIGTAQWKERFITLEREILDIAEMLARSYKATLLLPSLGMSLIIFGLNVATNLILLNGLGVDANVEFLVPAVSLAMMATVFPFSIAGFGIVESGWVAGLIFFAGLELGEAASFAFILHGIQICFAISVGLLGYVLMHFTVSKENGSVRERLASVDKDNIR